MECYWEPRSCIVPHTVNLLEISETGMNFKGYWYIEPSVVPVERILRVYGEGGKCVDYHIEITQILKEEEPFHCSVCERGEECDPEENHIRFFASEFITLKFNRLVEIQTGAYYQYAMKRIEELEKDVIEKNKKGISEREQIEMEEVRNIKYN